MCDLKHEMVMAEMHRIFKDLPRGAAHSLRVLAYAEEIMAGEEVDATHAQVITYAALLHDIGAVRALEMHGSFEGHWQEMEGPAIAEEILIRAGVDESIIARVRTIVGHHHSPDAIDGLDFAILWDADQMDNVLYGESESDDADIWQKIAGAFTTPTGRKLALQKLGLAGDGEQHAAEDAEMIFR